MKILLSSIFLLFLSSISLSAQNRKRSPSQSEAKSGASVTAMPVSRTERLNYAIGMAIGQKLKADSIELKPDFLCEAIKAAGSGSGALMTEEEIMRTLQEFEAEMRSKFQGSEIEADTTSAELSDSAEAEVFVDTAAAGSEETESDAEQQKLAETNASKGKSWLEENRKKSGVVQLPSGLQYQVIRKGKGASPGINSKVLAHYVGTKLDGTVFDSSLERDPVLLPVNGVIRGWTEALQLMNAGAKWKLFIPASLAYGNDSPAPIEPGETLIFEVDLLYILN